MYTDSSSLWSKALGLRPAEVFCVSLPYTMGYGKEPLDVLGAPLFDWDDLGEHIQLPLLIMPVVSQVLWHCGCKADSTCAGSEDDVHPHIGQRKEESKE